MDGFDWYKYAVGGAASRPDSFSKLNPEYATRVAQMIQAADAELGPGALKITSAYRSPELQAKLFKDAVAKYGSESAARKWVAPPGRSKHNFGMAVDFADASGSMLRDPNSKEAQWIKANAKRFGLDVPMSWEPWQVELAGSRGGAAGGDIVAGGGDVSLAGQQGQDTLGGGGMSLADIRAILKSETEAPEPEPIFDPSTLATDYAATGALEPVPMQMSDLRSILQGQETAPMQGNVDAMTGQPMANDGGALRGLGLGARNVAEGLAGTVGLAYDPIAAGMNLTFGTNIAPLRDQVSGLLTEAGVPEPQGVTERILAAIQQGAAGAIGSVGVGQAIGGGAGRVLSSGPVAQTMGGAGAGAGAQAAAESGAGAVGQLAAGLAGGVVGAAPASIRRPQISATAADDVARAERAGISPMTSDVFQPQTFIGRSVQRIGELIPLVGTGPMRAAQQAARVAAVRDLARQFGADAKASDDVMKDFLGKRQADLQKYVVLKNDVITSIPGNVDVTRTVAEVDNQIANLRSLKTAKVQPVIAELEDWKRAIQNQDLVNIDILRKQIGESFEAPELIAVRSTGKKALSAIYGPLKQDMGEHIKANGQPKDFTKWGVANARLSEMMGELDRTSLKSALDKGDQTPEAIRGLLFSKKPSDVKALYKGLTPDGRARARAAVLQEAIEKASDGENLSPQKFRSQLIKMGGQMGVFFGGDDLKAVDGLRRVLDMTSRAGETAAFGPTGVQTVPVVGGMALTDMAGGLGGGIVSAGVMGLSARAMESKAVRNMLMKLSTTAPGSPEEAALLKRVMEAARAEAGAKEEK